MSEPVEFNPDEENAIAAGIKTFDILPSAKTIPSIQANSFLQALKIGIPIIGGIILIAFGLSTTGSYYIPATRFGGGLAEFWYGWQAGNLLAIIGGIAIYDAIKRAGYL